MAGFQELPTFGPGGSIHVVIEAGKGATAKCKFDPSLGAFLFSRPLAHGLSYPFDWGFIPSTCGEDGDPLDAMVIHGAACPVGSIVRCRPKAVLQVHQTQDGKGMRNDRYILEPIEGGAGESCTLDSRLKKELEQFFHAAIIGTGKTLKVLAWRNPAAALAGIKAGAGCYTKSARQD
jgi:inorganic pyrophosphatase